ncbi:MAG: aspartate/glutamate racemase family protein [Candidatus Bathyarchaeia archaeon]
MSRPIKIMVINPNSSKMMSQLIEHTAKKYASSETQIIVTTSTMTPETIEDYIDYVKASEEVIQRITEGSKYGVDAYVIACYDDPGLYAGRQLVEVPVVGVAEASMLYAVILGQKFTFITISDRGVHSIEELVERYGFSKRCASIRAVSAHVRDLLADRDWALREAEREAIEAVRLDGAEVIILGCTGWTGVDKLLEEKIGVPVVDGVVAAVKLVEGLVSYGKKTSKVWSFKHPSYVGGR